MRTILPNDRRQPTSSEGEHGTRGKTIAITGASTGIGAATARLLAARGARVVLGARREDALVEVVAEIEADGGHAAACVVDVTQPEDLKRPVAHAVERFGRLDALVANAGVATSPRSPTARSPIGTGCST